MTRILAIHGFLGQAQDWESVKSYIQKHTKDVDFQTLDIFSSPAVTKYESLHDWAKEFNQMEKSKHVERNILLGYSLGGRLAMHAAADKPGLWDNVVLLSSHPGLMLASDKQRRKEEDEIWADLFKNLKWQDVVKLWNNQPVFQGSYEPVRTEESFDRSILTHALIKWSLAEQEFLGDALLQLKAKLFWYAGEKDHKFVNLFHALKSDGFIDHYRVVSGASHRLMFDNPEELAKLLIEDLKIAEAPI